MRAAVVHDFSRPPSLEDVPRPDPSDGEVVGVEACGLRRTDTHAPRDDRPVKPKLPLIPGHKGVGIFETILNGMKIAGCTVGPRLDPKRLRTPGCTEVTHEKRRADTVEEGGTDARLISDLGAGEPAREPEGGLTTEADVPPGQPVGEVEEHRAPFPG